MTNPPATRRALAAGLLLLLASVVLVLLGTSLRGPLDPSCAGRPWAAECRGWGLALQVAALPVAVAGGVLVAMWLARRDPEP